VRHLAIFWEPSLHTYFAFDSEIWGGVVPPDLVLTGGQIFFDSDVILELLHFAM